MIEIGKPEVKFFSANLDEQVFLNKNSQRWVILKKNKKGKKIKIENV